MAYNVAHPAAKPPIIPLYDNYHAGDVPRLHWYQDPDGAPRPGGRWIANSALATTRSEIVVHWEDGPAAIPPGQPESAYRAVLAEVAYYHAFTRDWTPDVPGVQGSDGLQYSYCIAPPPAGSAEAILYQVSPETKVTWHASADNVQALSVCMMAGRRDTYHPAMAACLVAFLDWMTAGRADLPLITATPQPVVLDGHTYQTHGVYTHDQTRLQQGLPVKGCCGVYAPLVKAWVAGLATEYLTGMKGPIS